jgi:hypothetical protein
MFDLDKSLPTLFILTDRCALYLFFDIIANASLWAKEGPKKSEKSR